MVTSNQKGILLGEASAKTGPWWILAVADSENGPNVQFSKENGNDAYTYGKMPVDRWDISR